MMNSLTMSMSTENF